MPTGDQHRVAASIDAASRPPSNDAAVCLTISTASSASSEGCTSRLHGDSGKKHTSAASSISCDHGPAPDGGLQAWLFLVAAWGIELSVWGVTYALGTLQDYHEHDGSSPFYGSNVTSLSSIGTLVIAFQHVVPIITYRFVAIYPHLIKRAAAGCVVASALCLVVISFATNVAVLIAFQGILFGLFGGFLFIPVILWLPHWFDKRRGLASGIFFSGSGVGGVVFPLLFNGLLSHIGFRWTMRVWALVHLVVAGSATLLIRPRYSVAPATVPAGDKRTLGGRILALLPPSTIRHAIHRQSILYIIIICLQAMGWYTTSLFISSFTTSHGYSHTTSTVVLILFNAFAVLGYVPTGSLVDRVHYTLIMAGSMTICGLAAIFILGFGSSSLAGIIAFAVLFGFVGGGFACQFTPMSRSVARLMARNARRKQPRGVIAAGAAAADEDDEADFGFAFFIVMLVRAVAVVAGPLIASALYPTDTEQGGAGEQKGTTYAPGGYVGIVVFIGASLLLTAAASLLLYWQETRSDAARSKTEAGGEKFEKQAQTKGLETPTSSNPACAETPSSIA